MASQSLKGKAARGVFWSSIDRFANQGISFCFSIFLARLLAPEDYGVIAMIVIFMAVSQTFVDSGFTSALIRKPDLTQKDLSTAFYFNIVVGVVCYAILFFASPLIANFYATPILSLIIKISGLGILFNSLCVVQRAILSKKIDFKTQAKISILGTIAGGTFGLFLAYSGYGVWALVFQSLIGIIINLIYFWFSLNWKPSLVFDKSSFKYLWGYGSKMLASGLLDTLYNNIYPIVIGKYYSPSQLGYFSRAQSYSSLLSSNITGILARATYPVLSEMQNEELRLQINYRKLLRVSAYIIFPLMIGLAVVSHPLILVMITAKWESCVAYLQIISLAMMWYPIHAINLNLLQVKGRSDLFFRLEVIKKIMGVLIMLITIPLGVLAMCWGMVVSSIISLVINTYYTGKLIHVGFLCQMNDLKLILLASFLMGGMSYVSMMLSETPAYKLLIGIPIGILSYLLLSFLFKFPELQELLRLLHLKK